MPDDKERIRANIAKMRTQGASDAEVEQYLQNVEGLKPTTPEPPATRSLVPKQSTVAASDATRALSRSRPNPSGDFQALPKLKDVPKMAGDVALEASVFPLVAAQGIPGMERGEAFLGSMGSKLTDHPMTYKESLEALRDKAGEVPSDLRTTMKMVGAAPLAAVKPLQAMSGVTSGALIGGADQALAADEMSPSERALRTLAGASIGGTVGAVLDGGVTLGRAKLAPSSSEVVKDLKHLRSEESSPLFTRAQLQGKAAGLGSGAPIQSPEIQKFLAQPDIKEIAVGLLETRKFAGRTADDPEVLDAIYKTLSDQSAQVKRGLEAATPNKPNIGRFRGEDIRAAKDEALNAMDAPMPDYRKAVQAYADRSSEIGAVRTGQDAVRGKLQSGITTGKNLDRTTQEAFEAWAAKATPAERERAVQGILGATKQVTKFRHPIKSAGALLNAPELLRATKTPAQEAFDALIKATLLGGNAVQPF